MRDSLKRFREYLNKKSLKLTRQRMNIAEIFLSAERHLSVEELYELLRQKGIPAGRATVFRTLKLFTRAGIAREVTLGAKTTSYEVKRPRQHHDHLVCTECGSYKEVVDDKIEKLQNKLCEKEGFLPLNHRLEIFGVCSICRRKNKQGKEK